MAIARTTGANISRTRFVSAVVHHFRGESFSHQLPGYPRVRPSETWKADLASFFSGKTIQAMLERMAVREVAGS